VSRFFARIMLFFSFIDWYLARILWARAQSRTRLGPARALDPEPDLFYYFLFYISFYVIFFLLSLLSLSVSLPSLVVFLSLSSLFLSSHWTRVRVNVIGVPRSPPESAAHEPPIGEYLFCIYIWARTYLWLRALLGCDWACTRFRLMHVLMLLSWL